MEGQHALEQACARLERDPDFRVFLDEIAKRREDARDALEQVTDLVLTGRAQGRASLAGELMELVQGARAALAKRQDARR